MTKLYTLLMQPLLKRYLWGGRKLGEVLGKSIGDGNDYAESWEVADHPQGQSTVANGPLAGISLGELVRTRGTDLMGIESPSGRFPLMFKFLDAQKDLSVQVHPSDAQGARLTPPDLGKTEAWLILSAEPGALLYAGLKSGVDHASLQQHLQNGTVDQCLHTFSPNVGDCVFIPAGTVHALGRGIMIAEIQQASDTTFRLFDWNRVGADGKPRPLHIEESLAVTDFGRGPVDPVAPQSIGTRSERLVSCDKFTFDRHTLIGPQLLETHGKFRIVSVLEGAVTIDDPFLGQPLVKGSTVVIPASCSAVTISPQPRATIIEMGLPG